MSLNRQSTKELFPELFEYACDVLKTKPECSTIMKWVREHNYQLTDFFLVYTVAKHDKHDETSYKAVLEEFKKQHEVELQKSYGSHSSRLWSLKDDLYNLVSQQAKQSQNIDIDTGTKLELHAQLTQFLLS